MSKKTFIINSNSENLQPLVNLIEELAKKNYAFSLLTNQMNDCLSKYFNDQKWQLKKIYFGPTAGSFLKNLIFLIIYLPLFFSCLIFFGYLKYEQQVDLIFCFGWNEKLLIAPVAKLLKIKCIWLELPGTNYSQHKSLWLYKIYAGWTNIIVLNGATKNKLEKLGIKPENIKIIQPGIKLNHFNFQDTIFNKLAQAENIQKKFFTIGTIGEFDSQQKMEPLLMAIKKCLTVVPNIQLIVVGEGKERKNLAWMAKKIEIDTVVWFVGEQAHLRKWLESFDLFVVSSETLKLNDMVIALNAMSAGLPIIGADNYGLDDLVFENKTGALLKFDSEALADEIIKLAQDKFLREKYGNAGKERVEKYFNLSKMVEHFEKVL